MRQKRTTYASVMSRLGVGVDIEDIVRFKRLPWERHKDFYEKVFSSDEIRYCMGRANPYQHFAARFCAKEAFIKALGEKIPSLAAIEVLLSRGKPVIAYQDVRCAVSLSHARNTAIAFVIVEKRMLCQPSR